MTAVREVGEALAAARKESGMSQRDLARRAGTAQSLVARIERGQANPTIDTLERLFAAVGRRVHLVSQPVPAADAVVDAYKRDVDRSLIRENLRRSVDDRLRLNAEVLALATSARRVAARKKT
jgi:transcriptional regulator with XRE-family HTH domain